MKLNFSLKIYHPKFNGLIEVDVNKENPGIILFARRGNYYAFAIPPQKTDIPNTEHSIIQFIKDKIRGSERAIITKNLLWFIPYKHNIITETKELDKLKDAFLNVLIDPITTFKLK